MEICINNYWGTVCDDLWGTADAGVVCRQLGLSGKHDTVMTKDRVFFPMLRSFKTMIGFGGGGGGGGGGGEGEG